MTHDAPQLIARLALVRAELLEQLTGLPAEALIEPPVFGDSSASDILAHIASWEEFFADRLRRVGAGRGEDIASVDVEERNARTAQERRGWSLERSLTAATEARAALLASFEAIPEQALHTPIRVPWGQPTVARWIEICIEHDKEHTADLITWRAALGEAAQATWHETGPGQLLASALAARRQALLSIIALIPERERETRPIVGTWTLAALAGHVADWDFQGMEFIRAILARRESVEEPDWDLDRWNAEKAAARAGQTLRSAWDDFLGARREVLALLSSLDDRALNLAFEGPLGGTPYKWFFMCVDHDREHTEDLRRLVDTDAG